MIPGKVKLWESPRHSRGITSDYLKRLQVGKNLPLKSCPLGSLGVAQGLDDGMDSNGNHEQAHETPGQATSGEYDTRQAYGDILSRRRKNGGDKHYHQERPRSQSDLTKIGGLSFHFRISGVTGEV